MRRKRWERGQKGSTWVLRVACTPGRSHCSEFVAVRSESVKGGASSAQAGAAEIELLLPE